MKLVEGHDLAKLLEQRVAPSQELPRFLTIFEQICQTLAYAHAQGVIHRDLKPHNVRVGAFGEVHLMDWGFAKELHQAQCNDRPSLSAAESTAVVRIEDTVAEGFGTQAGQVFGSLPYMPPEQARGEVEQVDERSDVFGLGAILCEILTGRPPFTGRDGKDLFAKARKCDHAEAMARLDGCGADSKLLRLAKACLAAERGDRPRNAGTVAKEVKAYLAGVQERLRAAERERAAEQARAEEAKKTAAAEQARAEEARKAAAAERWARRRTVWAAVAVLLVLVVGTVVSTMFAFSAREQAGVASKKAEAAIRADNEKTIALEEVEKTLVAGLLRPIGQKEGPLDPVEAEALMMLSNLSNESTRVRLIEEGLRSAETARRLNRRAGWAIQAAVGLDASRRHQVEELLMGRLRQREAPGEVREACVSLGIALEVQDPAFEELAAEPIVAATVRYINQNDLNGLPARLRAFSARLNTSGASKVADALVAAMSKPADLDALHWLSQGLQAVSGRLDASGATKAADALMVAMNSTDNPYVLLRLSQGLQAVSGRLEDGVAAAQASKAADILLVAMSKPDNKDALHWLSQGLEAVSGRLDASGASKAANALVAMMSKGIGVDWLSWGLRAVSGRLDASGASKVVDALVAVMSKTTERSDFYSLSEVLQAVSGRLDPSGASKAADLLVAAMRVAAMKKFDNEHDLNSLSKALQAVSGRLEDAAATAQASKAADILVAAMGEPINPGVDPAYVLREYSQGLEAVSERLDATAASKATDALVVAIKAHPTDMLIPALQAMSRRLDTSGASQAADTLVAAMSKTTYPGAPRLLSQGLQAVSGRLEDAAAATKASKAADILLAAMRNPDNLDTLSQGLQAVSGRLDASGARRAADALMVAMSKTTDPHALRLLSEGLQAVSGRLEDAAATAHASKTADVLVAAMSNTTDPNDLNELSQGLKAVSGRLDASVASKAADTLVAAMSKDTEPYHNLLALSQALQGVNGRLDDAVATAHASKAAEILVTAMSKTPYLYVLHDLSEGLQAVSGRLEDAAAAIQASKAANILAVAMSKYVAAMSKAIGGNSLNPNDLSYLSRGLESVSGRLDASGASKVADTLVATMSTTTDSKALSWLSLGLESVSGRLDASGASKVMMAMSKVPADPDVTRSLRSVMSTICERWSTPDVLTLLRHPLAAGEAQRALLDVLGHRNRRTFRNAWHFLDWAHSNGVDLIPHAPLDAGEP
jgi:hypothetical protein